MVCISIYGLNLIGVRSVSIYTVAGLILWLCVLNSGVHPTIAGVALGLLTPAYAWFDNFRLMRVWESVCSGERPDKTLEVDLEKIHELSETAIESISPLERLESALHPWVAFAIMPLFAFANAGVALDLGSMSHPVAIAVALGLVVGKPIGILLFSVLAVRLGVTRLPAGVTWWMLASGACLSGIGFTMSLFINTLSFADSNTMLDAGKIGIFIGSILSGLVGVFMLWITLRYKAAASNQASQPL
jgi:NhaA family Na+:H+ antiporter